MIFKECQEKIRGKEKEMPHIETQSEWGSPHGGKDPGFCEK